MRFSVFCALNWGQERVFIIQENVAFIQLSIYQSHNQFLPAMNKMMETKSLYILSIAFKQIACKPTV